MIRINIRARGKLPPGYIHCSFHRWPGIDRVFDLREVFPFDDSSVDEVRFHHGLEHEEDGYASFILEEVYRILKPGKYMDIEVPDMDQIVEAWSEATYEEKWEQIIIKTNRYIPIREYIWGHGLRGTGAEHYCGWDSERLKRYLEAAGFFHVEKKKPREGWCIRFLAYKRKDGR